MLKISKISASYSIKKQVRQYEPIEVFMGAEAEVNSDDEKIVKNAQVELFDLVKAAAEAMVEKVL